MRLIADFTDEKKASHFHNFLLQKGIENTCEPFKKEEAVDKVGFHLWIVDEDSYEKAKTWYERYLQNPEDPEFALSAASSQKKEGLAPLPPPLAATLGKVKLDLRSKNSSGFSVTNFFILLCVFLFFLTNVQEKKLMQKEGAMSLEFQMAPIEEALLFDKPVVFTLYQQFFTKYPVHSAEELKNLPIEEKKALEEIEKTPTWKGVSDLIIQRNLSSWTSLPPHTLFHKIREGEVWRLFTPCLLHQGFLHILFNMAWLWMLGHQIEARLGKKKTFLFIVVTGIVANISQYLISGPIFLGFSGVVVGMIGFIWKRQKIAPWEGYPLQKGTALFILLFVFAMLALEMVSFGLQFFHVTEISANIANTAHIIGGGVGVFLARLSVFSRSHK